MTKERMCVMAKGSHSLLLLLAHLSVEDVSRQLLHNVVFLTILWAVTTSYLNEVVLCEETQKKTEDNIIHFPATCSNTTHLINSFTPLPFISQNYKKFYNRVDRS